MISAIAASRSSSLPSCMPLTVGGIGIGGVGGARLAQGSGGA
ncbi:hypothetical protein [Chitinophaga vietnamensis]|nr:hypothetical protein [Chitinophaga vietnamensis]